MTAAADARVCPHCGEPPGEGVFCAACGRNLASVDRLPDAGGVGDRGREGRSAAGRALRRGDRRLPRRDARGRRSRHEEHEDVRRLGLPPAPSSRGLGRPPGRSRRPPPAQALRVRPRAQRRGRLPPARQPGPRLRHARLPRLGALGRAGAGRDAGRGAPDRRARRACSPPNGLEASRSPLPSRR